MGMLRRKAAVVAAALVASTAAAGGVVAATQSSDEAALEPARQPADRGIERRVDRLLRQMTLEEKLQQITLLPDFKVNEDEVRRGLGSVLSETRPARIRQLQEIAVEESRLGIPLLFAFDTIHGFRTVFPIRWGRVRASIRTWRSRMRGSARASPRRWGSSRPMRRWWTSRTSRAGGGSPRPPVRIRT
jgi:beta-glucosidase